MKTLVKKRTHELGQLNMNGTVFNINFDFNSVEQASILKKLIEGKYTLYGYKAAGGAGQIKEGVPVWFSQDYKNVFGTLNINYKPKYKVYIGTKRTAAANTTIVMSKLSPEIPLGTIVTVDEFGNFSTKPGGKPGTIQLVNNRPADTSPLTVGLAALVDGDYKMFCAFNSQPQNTISMEPKETVLLFAAQTGLVSGSVTATTAAPGCKFPFDSQHQNYPLEMIPVTFGIKSIEGGPIVTKTESSQNIAMLLGN